MISSPGPVLPVTPHSSPAQPKRAAEPEFGALLKNAIASVESSSASAAAAMTSFMEGSGADVHSVALSVQRASLEFELFLQVRNKVVQAYQDIMHLQL